MVWILFAISVLLLVLVFVSAKRGKCALAFSFLVMASIPGVALSFMAT